MILGCHTHGKLVKTHTINSEEAHETSAQHLWNLETTAHPEPYVEAPETTLS